MEKRYTYHLVDVNVLLITLCVQNKVHLHFNVMQTIN